MKKLTTLIIVLLMGIGTTYASSTEDDRRYRGYSNSFIFTEGGIEFAIFPDGQFDFNYLNDGPQFGVALNTPNAHISFNTGYNYDPYVQYDSYGAVIQIEDIPIFYDGYGRIIQAGDVFINYFNGYVNRVGNLNIFYSRPGVILRTTGFINPFNRFYTYQPWHDFYGAPLVNRCIVWNTPYRLYYNPYRFAWNYHRLNWNRPSYYNGCFARANVRRNFYRPTDRVSYRNFERGRRDNRGRAIATRDARRDREAINRGRRTISRTNNALASNERSVRNSNRTSEVSNRRSTSRTTGTDARSSRTTRRSNAATTNRSNTNRRLSTISSNKTNRTSTPSVSNRSTRTNRTSTMTNRGNSRSSSTVSNNRSSRRSSPNVSTRNTSRSNNSISSRSTSRRSTPSASTSSRSNRKSGVSSSRKSRSTSSTRSTRR